MYKFRNSLMRFYMEPDGGSSGDPKDQTGGDTGADGASKAQGTEINYDKIQKMLDGTLAAKEDTALKAYFKQQGLSQEEAERAMATFKQQKAAAQPDVAELQNQLVQAKAAQQKAEIESRATMVAIGLGIDAKTLPYVLRLADFSAVTGQGGMVDENKIKEVIEKVLADVPALKAKDETSGGFHRVGSDGGGQTGKADEEELKKAFGL